MILVFVTFRYGDDFDPERFNRPARARRDSYVGLDGLCQKIYWIDHARKEAGGIYAWASREAAERMYSGDWSTRAEQAFGAPPEIRFMDVTDVIVNSPVEEYVSA